MGKGLPLAAIGALLGVGLTACSGTDAPSPTPTPTPSASVAPRSTPIPTPPDFGPDQAGVAADVSIAECQLALGAVQASGTALNSATEPRDIAVIVIWLKNDSGSPLGSGLVVLEQVPPGESRDWQVDAETVEMPERCVLNATAGQAGGAEASDAESTDEPPAEPSAG